MKARKNGVILYFALAFVCFVVATVCLVTSATEPKEEVTTAGENAVKKSDLTFFGKSYVTLPEIDVRANAETPGRVDTLYVGDEVKITQQKGIYVEFTYVKDGEERYAATWTGAISPGIRIHLLEEAFVYRKPNQSRDTIGTIVMWREPSDPDLIILGEEEGWLYVLSTEDCRAGYMHADAKYEIVS